MDDNTIQNYLEFLNCIDRADNAIRMARHRGPGRSHRDLTSAIRELERARAYSDEAWVKEAISSIEVMNKING